MRVSAQDVANIPVSDIAIVKAYPPPFMGAPGSGGGLAIYTRRGGEVNPQAEQALLSWYEETSAAFWHSPNELKAQYRNASILTNKRVVFYIHGNFIA